MTDNNKTRLSWFLRLIAAVIMLQTLFFKFSAAEESVYIFSALGMEPWGRIATGVMELLASMLILIPSTTVIGAILGLGIMAGALLSHLVILGIEVREDGGQLFIYALLVFFSSLFLLLLNRKKISVYMRSFFFK